MIKKSEIVKAAVREQNWKKALLMAKDFRIGVTQEQRDKMARAYECIVYPEFYRQIGVDIPEAIEQGKAVVKEYTESRRKNGMKWDEKHDRAKKAIDFFLEGAVCYLRKGEFAIPEIGNLVGGLTEEEKALVSAEVESVVTSIRKRFKLQERLTEQAAQIEPEKVEVVISTEKEEETLPESTSGSEEKAKFKRTRRVSTGEEKVPARRHRTKKEEKEA